MMDTMTLETWQVVGRLIREAARGEVVPWTPIPVEQPPIGALVVEATHAWAHRRDWPIREGVGWVERVEPEDERRPLSDTNVRVVIRLFDPGDGEPLQPWLNANFYVAPEAAALSREQERST